VHRRIFFSNAVVVVVTRSRHSSDIHRRMLLGEMLIITFNISSHTAALSHTPKSEHKKISAADKERNR
jgi:hypothetical protein